MTRKEALSLVINAAETWQDAYQDPKDKETVKMLDEALVVSTKLKNTLSRSK